MVRGNDSFQQYVKHEYSLAVLIDTVFVIKSNATQFFIAPVGLTTTKIKFLQSSEKTIMLVI